MNEIEASQKRAKELCDLMVDDWDIGNICLRFAQLEQENAALKDDKEFSWQRVDELKKQVEAVKSYCEKTIDNYKSHNPCVFMTRNSEIVDMLNIIVDEILKG